jgi:hypothetical protein
MSLQDQTDDFYDLPREFHLLGSCLFHKGLLVASHLAVDQLSDVRLWCKTNRLLKLTRHQKLHRLVTWQEIFPDNQNDTSLENRHFLLVVGRDHQVLAVLLQTGGCTAQPSGVVRPDPFYVDQVIVFVRMTFVRMTFVRMTFVRMTFVRMTFVRMTFFRMTFSPNDFCLIGLLFEITLEASVYHY